MSTLEQIGAESAADHEALNPANSGPITEANRVSMNLPTAKLAVPPIPGFHLHWFRNEAGRLERAQKAGYEFVEEEEVTLVGGVLGSDTAESRNTDMGSRVSMVAGGTNRNGEPTRLYLMKIREDWWKKDQTARDDSSQRFVDTLFGRETFQRSTMGDAHVGAKNTYLDRSRSKMPEFFKRKPAK